MVPIVFGNALCFSSVISMALTADAEVRGEVFAASETLFISRVKLDLKTCIHVDA